MLVRIITHRLNKLNYGDIIEEDSPRVKCLLENGEAEVVKDDAGIEEPILADPITEEKPEEIIEAPVEAPVEIVVKKKAGRPKKVK